MWIMSPTGTSMNSRRLKPNLASMDHSWGLERSTAFNALLEVAIVVSKEGFVHWQSHYLEVF